MLGRNCKILRAVDRTREHYGAVSVKPETRARQILYPTAANVFAVFRDGKPVPYMPFPIAKGLLRIATDPFRWVRVPMAPKRESTFGTLTAVDRTRKHYGDVSVEPETSRCPPDICI